MLHFLALFLVTTSLHASSASSTPPDWALKDTQSIEGTRFRVVCSGSGPSIGFARQSALDSCKLSAAQQVTTEVTVKSMSLTSEREVAFQQEVLNHSRVSGLFCLPRREQIQEIDHETRLWLLCEFDLSKARIVHNPNPVDGDPSDDRPLLARGGYQVDERKVLTLAVVPGCSDLIVRGHGPARRMPCGQNPVSVVLGADDREIILRAKDHLPKSIYLGPKRLPRGYAEVYLQPNP